MKTTLLTLPGYRVCEYLLALKPSDDLVEKIAGVKNNFFEEYKTESAKWSKPHITLIKFSQLLMMEDRIVNKLKTLAMSMMPFKVELNNFGSFPSHTIYINIESKASVQKLVKHLKPAQSLLKTKDTKPHFIDNFYITIARQISQDQYEKAWLEYQHLSFSGKFIAENMLLLRRPEGTKSYQQVQTFDFLNLPVVSTQGSLF